MLSLQAHSAHARGPEDLPNPATLIHIANCLVAVNFIYQNGKAEDRDVAGVEHCSFRFGKAHQKPQRDAIGHFPRGSSPAANASPKLYEI